MSEVTTIVARTAVPVLSTKEKALDAARAYAVEIEPGAAERDRDRIKPLAELQLLAESGLLSLRVPRALGGPELPHSVPVEVLRILAGADPTISQMLIGHYMFCEHVADALEGERTRELLGSVLHDGARFGNAVSERGTANMATYKTVAAPVDGSDEWEITGRKFYATGALAAPWIGIVARGPYDSPTQIMIPADARGVTLDLEDWSSFGQRATFSGTVILDHVRVPSRYVLNPGPPPATTPPIALGAYDQALHAAVDVGIAGGALADGAAFVRERTRPWIDWEGTAAEEPMLLRRFGEMTAQLHALEALLARATGILDETFAAPALTDDNTAAASIAVAEAKALAQDFAVGIASGIFELMGASATDGRWDFDRHWRNVRTHSLHDPARWKLYYVGNYVVNGVRPPRIRAV